MKHLAIATISALALTSCAGLDYAVSQKNRMTEAYCTRAEPERKIYRNTVNKDPYNSPGIVIAVCRDDPDFDETVKRYLGTVSVE